VSSRREAAWAEHAENRFPAFTNLIAMAISNADAIRPLEHVAAEQAALRRVATLVAQGASAPTVAAVAAEVGQLFDADLTVLARHDSDYMVAFGAWSHTPEWVIPVGTRRPVGVHNAMAAVYRTGRSARRESRRGEVLAGPVYDAARDVSTGGRLLVTSVAASPLRVAGQLWGAISVSATDSLPHDAEARLGRFADIVVAAIANADSRSPSPPSPPSRPPSGASPPTWHKSCARNRSSRPSARRSRPSSAPRPRWLGSR
jgi:transcriptional regulator with GAF, ATPase, and Fis domain